MQIIKTIDTYLDQFVYDNQLQPADAILVKKMYTRLLNHYIIYLGFYRTRHIFMANTLKGIKLFNYKELMTELTTFQPEKIERFTGSDFDRGEAVKRALSRKDENSYHLILNNCEHFKNWVQKGVHASLQTETAGKLALGAGAAIALSNKSDAGKVLGIGLMILGGLAWALSDDETKMPPPRHIPSEKLLLE
jgi:hypothetical protein